MQKRYTFSWKKEDDCCFTHTTASKGFMALPIEERIRGMLSIIEAMQYDLNSDEYSKEFDEYLKKYSGYKYLRNKHD